MTQIWLIMNSLIRRLFSQDVNNSENLKFFYTRGIAKSFEKKQKSSDKWSDSGQGTW